MEPSCAAEILLGVLESTGGAAGAAGAELVRAELERENAVAQEEAQAHEAHMAGLSLSGGDIAVGPRLGVSASRSQGMYGVNSVVYSAVVRGHECALKGIITPFGPFDEHAEDALEHATRDELRQPPHSPHLLRYYTHFNAVVDGDLAREWPRDVTTTPIGSLTKFLAMPLIPAGNLQAFVRANPVRDEDALLAMVYQLLKAVCTLVDHQLLHRDIKLDNILVREDGTAGGGRSPLRLLLADFGTLQPMANQDRGCTPGNPMKVAPELRTLQDLGRDAAAVVDLTKAEVWAVGALCFDLLGERAPYAEADSTSLPLGPAVSQLTQAVVRRMLAWRPEERLSALTGAAWVKTCRELSCGRASVAAIVSVEQEAEQKLTAVNQERRATLLKLLGRDLGTIPEGVPGESEPEPDAPEPEHDSVAALEQELEQQLAALRLHHEVSSTAVIPARFDPRRCAEGVKLSADAATMTPTGSGTFQTAVCVEPLLDGRRYYIEVSRPPGLKVGTMAAGVVGPQFDPTLGPMCGGTWDHTVPGGIASPYAWQINSWDGRVWHGNHGVRLSWEGRLSFKKGTHGDKCGLLLDLMEGSMYLYLDGQRYGPIVQPRTLRGPLYWAVDSRHGNSLTVEAKPVPAVTLRFAKAAAGFADISDENGLLAKATKLARGSVWTVAVCDVVQIGTAAGPMITGKHWVAFEICQGKSVIGLYGAEGLRCDERYGGVEYWCIGSHNDGRLYRDRDQNLKLNWVGQESFPAGSVMGLEYDADAGSLRVWKNGALLGIACDGGVVAHGGMVWGVSMGLTADSAVRVRSWAGPDGPFPT